MIELKFLNCPPYFQAIGGHFEKMGVLEEENDIFYLTVEEIRGFIEGRALVLSLKDISLSRKKNTKNLKTHLLHQTVF